jgi:DNA-binding IscR family transcriptional regulator
VRASELSLLNIVDAVDGLADFERCPAGLAECNDNAPCGMHDSWKALRSRIIEYLERTSIEDLAKSFEQKRRNLEKMAKKSKRSALKKA